jgi:Holliday junction resolvase RusA-like endonuclease
VSTFADVTIPGRPEQKGSMRVNRHGAVFSDNPRLKGWQQKAALAIAKAREGRPLEAGPVSLIAEFRFARPPSHYTKTGALRAGAPQAPGRPDLDKLLRALLDASGAPARAASRRRAG